MASDDTTRLTAYVDDELDAGSRLAVESALNDHPECQAELDAIRATRLAVGMLPRPVAPRDIALDVIREIESRGIRAPRPVLRRHAGRGTWFVLGGLTTVAASLLVVWLTHILDPAPGRDPELRPAAGSRHVANLESSAPVGVLSIAETPPPSDPMPSAPELATATATDPALDAEDRLLANRDRLSNLLGLGQPRRVVLALDRLDSEAIDRVDLAIQSAGRTDARHARVRVEAGVGFDPELPGTAVVYVLPLRPTEARSLLRQLDQLLPGRVSPAASLAPGVVASLGETRGPVAYHEAPPHSLLRPEGPASTRSPVTLRARRARDESDIVDLHVAPPPTPADPLRAPAILPPPSTAPPPHPPAPEVDSLDTYILWLTERPETSPTR